MTKKVYVDTCIYLNIWKQEENKQTNENYWKMGKEFFKKAKRNNWIILFSSLILKELKSKLTQKEFYKKKYFLENKINSLKINVTSQDLIEASKLEKKLNYEISFLDINHMLIAKKNNAILITRDKKLIEISNKFSVIAKKPEELL